MIEFWFLVIGFLLGGSLGVGFMLSWKLGCGILAFIGLIAFGIWIGKDL